MKDNEIIEYSYSQFSELIGVQRGAISMYVKRGKLHADRERKKININHPKNIEFLKRREDKKNGIIKNDVGRPKGSKNKSTLEIAKNKKYQERLMQIRDLDIEKKKGELLKQKNDYELQKLKIEKARGELIPFDAVKTIFSYTIDTYRTIYMQELRSIANVYLQRIGGDHNEYIRIQKQLSEKIIEITKLVQKNLMSGLNTVILEYQETRSRGESKL